MEIQMINEPNMYRVLHTVKTEVNGVESEVLTDIANLADATKFAPIKSITPMFIEFSKEVVTQGELNAAVQLQNETQHTDHLVNNVIRLKNELAEAEAELANVTPTQMMDTLNVETIRNT